MQYSVITTFKFKLTLPLLFPPQTKRLDCSQKI